MKGTTTIITPADLIVASRAAVTALDRLGVPRKEIAAVCGYRTVGPVNNLMCRSPLTPLDVVPTFRLAQLAKRRAGDRSLSRLLDEDDEEPATDGSIATEGFDAARFVGVSLDKFDPTNLQLLLETQQAAARAITALHGIEAECARAAAALMPAWSGDGLATLPPALA